MFTIRGSQSFITQQTTYCNNLPPDFERKTIACGSLPLIISGDFIPKPTIIKAAYREVLKSKCPRYRHSAVIFSKNKILVSTYNIQRKTHPYGSGPHGTVHAEVRAIVKAINLAGSLRGFKIFIMRLGKNGEFKPSKPCIDCIKLIKDNGLELAWTDGVSYYDGITPEAKERLKRNYGVINIK